MIKFALLVLLGASIGLIAYPFWGVFAPETIRPELAEHYAYHPSASSAEVVSASYWLLLPNLILASALVCLCRYFLKPSNRAFANIAAGLIAVVPFSKIYASAEMGFILTSRTDSPVYAIEISTEGLLYFLFALVVVTMAKSASHP
tara:strand:- start:23120 stop:23557 length:438 start_codon:yes stop_codon:yes gene_type:complete